MKKRTIVEIVCGILIFIVGFSIGSYKKNNNIAKTTSTAEVKNNAPKTKVATEPKQEEKQEEKKEDSNAKLYKFGEEGVSGNWSIKVLDVKETTSVKGGSDTASTQEKFAVIKLQIKNISKSPMQYSANEFFLANMNDKSQYTISDTAFDAMGNANSEETIYKKNSKFVGVYTDINPNTTRETYIVFEIPKDMNIAESVLLNAKDSSSVAGFILK